MGMKVGLLWYDDDPKRALEEKIARAVQRYREKFGRLPNTCYVNPATLGEAVPRFGRVRVVAAPNILPHHFWIGVSEGKDNSGNHRRQH